MTTPGPETKRQPTGAWEVRTGPRGLSVRSWRPFEAPTEGLGVVAVHGTMDRSASFVRTAEALAAHISVPFFDAYDRAGYARSGALPPRRHFEESVDDLVAVLAGRRAVVVGHSFGAVVALGAAQRHVDLVAGVVAFEPPMPWVHPGEDDAREAAFASERPEEAAEIFLRRVAGDRAWRLLPEATKEERRREGLALACDLAALRSPEPPFDPAKVLCPVLVGSGTTSTDRHRKIARLLAKALPDGRLAELEGAPHGAHRSAARAFAGLVELELRAVQTAPGRGAEEGPLPFGPLGR